jgi:hypothetical protein
MRRLACFFLFALAAAGAQAQPFTVVSSRPADHTAAVPLETTLALTFSARVFDYEGGFNTAPTLLVLPDEAAVVGSPTRSADGLTLTFPLTLQPGTRYVALLLGAQSEAFAPITRPFAVNFTTAASNGAFTVRGTVTATDGLVPDGALVALVTGDVATGDVQIVAADVVEGGAASLPYTLGPVPIGLYTAGAVLLPLPLGASTDGFGYGLYDPDGDGTPNPIFATSGIDIAVASPPPRTAGDGFEEVQAAADGAVGSGAGLLAIDPSPVDALGASPVWSYRFGGPSANPAAEARVLRLGLFVLPVLYIDDVVGQPTLPTEFVDSDLALAGAEQEGGAAFRAAHPGETVTVTMRADPSSGFPTWYVDYVAQGGDALTVPVTFNFVAAEGDPEGALRRLVFRSANPARGSVEAALTLAAPTEARVTVVDAQGRTVAVLLDGPLGAGTHAVRWAPAPGLPAGVYWLRAEAAGRTEAVAVTRVR